MYNVPGMKQYWFGVCQLWLPDLDCMNKLTNRLNIVWYVGSLLPRHELELSYGRAALVSTLDNKMIQPCFQRLFKLCLCNCFLTFSSTLRSLGMHILINTWST